jgi:hypothetical protein
MRTCGLATTWGSPQFNEEGRSGRRESEMKPVYDAANLIDAHLVRHALEDAGLPVFIRGEALTGGIGELPVYGMVQVCVPDAAWAEAEAIVRALDFGQPPDADPEADWDPSLAPA